MTKNILTFFLLLVLTKSFSQLSKNTSKSLTGQWRVAKYYQTYGQEKKERHAIEDTSAYVFSADSTYILTCVDLWGKAKIVGKWKRIKENKFYLYDITHISEVKGPLPVNYGYEIELKTVNKQQVLFISSYDKPVDCLTELFYIKTK